MYGGKRKQLQSVVHLQRRYITVSQSAECRSGRYQLNNHFSE